MIVKTSWTSDHYRSGIVIAHRPPIRDEQKEYAWTQFSLETSEVHGPCSTSCRETSKISDILDRVTTGGMIEEAAVVAVGMAAAVVDTVAVAVTEVMIRVVLCIQEVVTHFIYLAYYIKWITTSRTNV